MIVETKKAPDGKERERRKVDPQVHSQHMWRVRNVKTVRKLVQAITPYRALKNMKGGEYLPPRRKRAVQLSKRELMLY